MCCRRYLAALKSKEYDFITNLHAYCGESGLLINYFPFLFFPSDDEDSCIPRRGGGIIVICDRHCQCCILDLPSLPRPVFFCVDVKLPRLGHYYYYDFYLSALVSICC